MEEEHTFTQFIFDIFLVGVGLGGMSIGDNEVTTHFGKFLAGGVTEIGGRVVQDITLGGGGGILICIFWN